MKIKTCYGINNALFTNRQKANKTILSKVHSRSEYRTCNVSGRESHSRAACSKHNHDGWDNRPDKAVGVAPAHYEENQRQHNERPHDQRNNHAQEVDT